MPTKRVLNTFCDTDCFNCPVYEENITDERMKQRLATQLGIDADAWHAGRIAPSAWHIGGHNDQG